MRRGPYIKFGTDGAARPTTNFGRRAAAVGGGTADFSWLWCCPVALNAVVLHTTPIDRTSGANSDVARIPGDKIPSSGHIGGTASRAGNELCIGLGVFPSKRPIDVDRHRGRDEDHGGEGRPALRGVSGAQNKSGGRAGPMPFLFPALRFENPDWLFYNPQAFEGRCLDLHPVSRLWFWLGYSTRCSGGSSKKDACFIGGRSDPRSPTAPGDNPVHSRFGFLLVTAVIDVLCILDGAGPACSSFLGKVIMISVS